MSVLKVKKLVSRSLHRDQFIYRRLTDKPLTAGTDMKQQQLKTVTDVDRLSAGK